MTNSFATPKTIALYIGLAAAFVALALPGKFSSPRNAVAMPTSNYFVNTQSDDSFSLEELLEINACTMDNPTRIIAPPCSVRSASKLANAFGGAIRIPPGTYIIAGFMLIDQASTVEFNGSDQGNTTLNGAGVSNILWVSHKDASVVMRDLHLTNGSTAGVGGAVFTSGELTLERVIISHSHASNSGGAVGIASPDHKTLRIVDSIIRDNHANVAGGGISLYQATTNLELIRTQVISNTTNGDAGGLDLVGTAWISHSTIANNIGFRVGGLRALADITILDSSIVSNRTDNHSAGIAIGAPNGIPAKALIQRSLIANNVGSGWTGGGISVFPNSSLIMENSTVSGNQIFGEGGGLHVQGSAILRFVTLTGNTASLSGGGIDRFASPPGVVSIADSILWNNRVGTTPSDCANGISSSGTTIVSSPTSCTISGGTAIHLDPLLAELGDNGGPTYTHLPAINSPAVDAIECFLSGNTDQRGQLRPTSGINCDLGAVERQPQDYYIYSVFMPVVLRSSP